MASKWQFSLSRLLVQICFLSVALGCSRIVVIWITTQTEPLSLSEAALYFAALVGGITAWGAFFGGLFGNIWRGAIVAWALFLFWFVFLAPRVQ
jgi:hypothetical protein